MRPERIALFPLNVVLLPGAELPLHIFEPRYREMIKHCLEEKLEFGMLLSIPKGLARVGCTAEIVEVLKRGDDGSVDILTVGRAPFQVLELFTEVPLLHGRVNYPQDAPAVAGEPLRSDLVELYETCHTLVFGDYPKNLDGGSSENPSYAIAAALPMDLPWKQQILELRNEADRQQRLVSYLREWAPHLQKAATVRSRAGGNGHGMN
jgi:Lon protease-like protein